MLTKLWNLITFMPKVVYLLYRYQIILREVEKVKKQNLSGHLLAFELSCLQEDYKYVQSIENKMFPQRKVD